MKKQVLGKGLASLLQTNSTASPDIKNNLIEKEISNTEIVKKEPLEISDNSVLMVDISDIKINKNQPRKIFKEEELEELSKSIKENGVIQPLLVIQEENKFEIIAGERRYRASKMANIDKVPVIVKKVTDRQRLIISIIENVQRSNLNCIEEALAYFQLMEDFGLTQEDVAKRVGKERSTVANFLRILKLPRKIIEALHRDQLTFGHAKILAGVKDVERANRLAHLCIVNSLSVKELSKLVKKKEKVKTDRVNPFEEKFDGLKENLERKTGFHFGIKSSSPTKAAGSIMIKFQNEAEFNDIYDFFMK